MILMRANPILGPLEGIELQPSPVLGPNPLAVGRAISVPKTGAGCSSTPFQWPSPLIKYGARINNMSINSYTGLFNGRLWDVERWGEGG